MCRRMPVQQNDKSGFKTIEWSCFTIQELVDDAKGKVTVIECQLTQ